MTIPKLTPYTGQVANPDGSQTQTEFTQNMFDQLSYEAQLATQLDATIDGMNNAVDEVEANAISAQNSANAAEAAAASAGYQGLWPDTGGSALKGEIWQTQVGGTPTGEYYTALQNTSVDPVGDNVNWKVAGTIGQQNLSDYTDIVYKASGGNSAVENMIAGIPVAAKVGDICSTGNTRWIYSGAGGYNGFTLISPIHTFDFGLVGDGVTDDTVAMKEFHEACVAIGDNITIEYDYPKNFYSVTNLKESGDPSFYGQTRFGLYLAGASGITINYNNSPIKVSDGTYYGSYDPVTGSPVDFPTGPDRDDYIAYVGNLLQLDSCSNIDVSGMNFDGNNQGVNLGGRFGDTGWQIQMFGLRMLGQSFKLNIRDCHVKNSCLDGFSIKTTSDSTLTSNQITLTNCSAEFGARQGLSLAGGVGHTLINCKFNFTGQGAFSSAPTAGIDIEPEAGYCYGVTFINCQCLCNIGVGLVSDLNGEVDNISWIGGTLWGSNNHALWWVALGRITFTNAVIHGQIAHANKSTYNDCVIDDLPHPDYGIYRTSRTTKIINNISETYMTNTTVSVSGQRGFAEPTYGANCKFILAYDFNDPDIVNAFENKLAITISGTWSNSSLVDEITGTNNVTNLPYLYGSPDFKKSGGYNVIDGNGNIGGGPNSPVGTGYNEFSLGDTGELGVHTFSGRRREYRSTAFPNIYYEKGSILWATSPVSRVGQVCTTAGTGGVDAVFKTFGAID